jgi:hypothetical protein
MESVHILVRIDGIENFFFINVFGQGQLDQDTVDAVVLVVLVDQRQQIRFGMSTDWLSWISLKPTR